MTPIERAREAAVFADARADAVRAVLHRRIKDDFHTVIQHADGSRTHAVSHDQELANAAIDTFLASLSAQGLVIVPKDEYDELVEDSEAYERACSAAEDHRWD